MLKTANVRQYRTPLLQGTPYMITYQLIWSLLKDEVPVALAAIELIDTAVNDSKSTTPELDKEGIEFLFHALTHHATQQGMVYIMRCDYNTKLHPLHDALAEGDRENLNLYYQGDFDTR